MKRCSRCGNEFPIEDFPVHTRLGDEIVKRNPLCRTCYNARANEYYQANKERISARSRERWATDPEYAQRKRDIARRSRDADPTGRRKKGYDLKGAYGITIDQYEALAESQNHLCAICGASTQSERNRRLHLDVDHDHDSKIVRGLLCNACNLGIGKFNDDPVMLEKAARYLRIFRSL